MTEEPLTQAVIAAAKLIFDEFNRFYAEFLAVPQQVKYAFEQG